jgi:hypothetical protein
MNQKAIVILLTALLTGGTCLSQTNQHGSGEDETGTAHEWLTWRRDLFQFAQLLFK